MSLGEWNIATRTWISWIHSTKSLNFSTNVSNFVFCCLMSWLECILGICSRFNFGITWSKLKFFQNAKEKFGFLHRGSSVFLAIEFFVNGCFKFKFSRQKWCEMGWCEAFSPRWSMEKLPKDIWLFFSVINEFYVDICDF
jgi:hypothetical protein